MSEFYSENQNEIDKIDRFVLENSPYVVIRVRAELKNINSHSILSHCNECIKMKGFHTELVDTLNEAMFYSVRKLMSLDEKEFPYPMDRTHPTSLNS
jgi:hypothetical protein